MTFAEATKPLRHKIVKMLAPKLYEDSFTKTFPRPMISFIRNQNRKDLVGAEIGVAEGYNAESILETLNIKKLFLIDPTRFVKAVKTRLSRFNVELVFLQKTSEEAVNDVTEPLDFVYIDGNHNYDFVSRDIHFYYPLVKKGGVLGGHDYACEWPSVVKAVNEFSVELGVVPFILFPDWWFQK